MENREDFIEKVKQIMNDATLYSNGNVQFYGADTTQIEYHVDKLYEDAWRKAINSELVPRELFDVVSFINQKIDDKPSEGIGDIHLPDDYYTLYSLTMKSWVRSVTKAISKENHEYKLQSNVFTRGSHIRPIALYHDILYRYYDKKGTEQIEHKKALTYYSIPRGTRAEMIEALYIPYPKPLDEELVKNDKLKLVLAYLVASLIYGIQEKSQQSQVLETFAFTIV